MKTLIALVLLNSINISIGVTPNILIFLVDDLGYGDLGCYGNDTIDSVHIDSLAKEGVRYTQMYSAASICTPSRGSLLTGRYSIRLGLTSNDNRFRTFNSPGQSGGLPHEETTIAEVAQQLGYRTALIGKWHLGLGRNGEHLPIYHGFDSFFGMPVTNVQTCGNKKVYSLIGSHGESIDRSFVLYWILLTGKVWLTIIVLALGVWYVSSRLAIIILLLGISGFVVGLWYTLSFTLLSRSSCLLYRNETIIEQPVYLENLTLRNTNEAVEFIKDATLNHNKPFFLLMSYIKVHTALFTLPENSGRSQHGPYGDNVEELDWSVGQILQVLKRLHVENNTLVLFASDNGPFLERGIEAGFCGRAITSSGTISEPLRGGKGQTWECGVRIPALMRWPGHILPGQVIDTVTSLLDIYPSLLEIWNVLPSSKYPLDGVSVWPQIAITKDAFDSLLLTSTHKERDTLFHYCGSTITAVRQGKYKSHFWTAVWDKGLQACPSVTICACLGTQHTPPLLFDIEADPGETNPLDVSKHLDVLSSMADAVRKHQETVVPVTNQLESLGLPWLFPCCNSKGWTRIFRLVTNSCQC